MAGNIGMELNLVVDKIINCVLPNFIPPTFNTVLKLYALTLIDVCLHYRIECISSQGFKIYKAASWPCLRIFFAK